MSVDLHSSCILTDEVELALRLGLIIPRLNDIGIK